MAQSSDGPFSDILVDLGDSNNNDTGGFKFKFAPNGKAAPSSSFNAAKAIFDVFGFFDPSDPDLPPPDAPESPTPVNIFASGGFEEAPSTSFATSQAFGIQDAVLPFAGPSGDAVPLNQQQESFVTPRLRTGGFEVCTPTSFGGGGDASFGGGRQRPLGGRNAPFGGGFQQRSRGFQNQRGNSDSRQYRPQPWNNAPPTSSNALRQSANGFGRSNQDIALLSGRTRSGSKGNGSSNKKRCNGRGRAPEPPVSTDPKQGAQEQPKESTEQKQPFDAGAKRAKSFGENGQGMEIAHKRPRLSCGFCGRAGHSTTHCYSARNRESLRCYNCNNMGHLAVRCAERGAGRGRGAAMPRINEGATGEYHGGAPNNVKGGGSAEDNKAHDNNNGKSGSGLDLICKLMQDTRMRKEAQRHTPKLYDDMLTFMLEHVKIGSHSA